MNGIHDMGGMHGMGPIRREADEPVFHAPWEGRMFALTSAVGRRGDWTIDGFRHTRERMPPADYLGKGYYEHWLYALGELLVGAGLITAEELRTGRASPGAAPDGRPLMADEVEEAQKRGHSARVDAAVAPRFQAGDGVVARTINPTGHTRLPRYVRGRRGVVDRDHGVFVFPDTNAHRLGQKPQHVYSVRFAARELWGNDAPPVDRVHVDLWDDYLDPA